MSDVSPSGSTPATAPIVSVVISAKNRPDSLRRTLESVRRQDFKSVEIVVVDDGSEPALPPMGDDVRMLRNPQSLGMCGARNMGFRAAIGRYVIVMDDDAEFATDDAITRAVRWVETVPRCAVVGFRQLRPDRSKHYMQPASSEEPCLTNRFYGYGFLFVREVMEELGGFRDPYGYYQEEIEVSLRLFKRGYQIVFGSDVMVLHHEDPRGRNMHRIGRLQFRNGLLTVLLTYPAWAVLPGALRNLQLTVRNTRGYIGLDLSGKWNALKDVAGLMPYVASHRESVGARALFEYFSLGRHPRPLSAPLPSEPPAAPNSEKYA